MSSDLIGHYFRSGMPASWFQIPQTRARDCLTIPPLRARDGARNPRRRLEAHDPLVQFGSSIGPVFVNLDTDLAQLARRGDAIASKPQGEY